MTLDELLAADPSPTPWKVGEDGWEGDGGAGVIIDDAQGKMVAFVASWSGSWDTPCGDKPTARDRANAELIVAAVNAVALAKGALP